MVLKRALSDNDDKASVARAEDWCEVKQGQVNEDGERSHG